MEFDTGEVSHTTTNLVPVSASVAQEKAVRDLINTSLNSLAEPHKFNS